MTRWKTYIFRLFVGAFIPGAVTYLFFWLGEVSKKDTDSRREIHRTADYRHDAMETLMIEEIAARMALEDKVDSLLRVHKK